MSMHESVTGCTLKDTGTQDKGHHIVQFSLNDANLFARSIKKSRSPIA